MYKIDILESTNLILKPYSTNDSDYVCKVHSQNDYYIWDDLENPHSTAAFRDKMNLFLNNNTFGWVIWYKTFTLKVGVLYFTNMISGLSTMIHPISDRQGYRDYLKLCNGNPRIKIMQEALSIACPYVFNKFKLLRITGGFFDYNTLVIHLCKNIGFKEEGLIRNGTRHNNQIVNIKLLGLLKEDVITYSQS